MNTRSSESTSLSYVNPNRGANARDEILVKMPSMHYFFHNANFQLCRTISLVMVGVTVLVCFGSIRVLW